MILFSSCGEPIEIENSVKEPQTEFLFSIIGMIMAVAVTNLIKGVDILIKYAPKSFRRTRWELRLLWGLSLALLIFQLVWGMRLALDQANKLFYFAYYVLLAGLVYGMVVYIFPENIENTFITERKEGKEKDWTGAIIVRLSKMYVFYLGYLVTTTIISFWFMDQRAIRTDIDPFISNWIGILLKIIGSILVFVALQQKRIKKEGILKLDYWVIGMSIIIHIYYVVIRTAEFY
jgi:hypothetical protein